MHVQRNRIFVGNLPPSVNENDIKEQFSQYGQIVSVEIKHRKENSNDNVSPVFAFVSIETDKNQLNECFNEVPNYNWHGYYVKLELAKESFLERLKREREEAQANNNSAKPAAAAPTPTKFEENSYNPPIITASKSNKIVYSSSTSSSSSESSDSENEVVKVPKTTVKTKAQNGELISSDNNDLVIKNNKNKRLTNGKLIIESVNSTPIHIITRKQNGLHKEGQKLTPADEKRLNSLYKMKESYDQQKSLIKNALSHIDTKTTNKIVFDENGQQSNKRKQNFNDRQNNYKKEKVSLFADNEEEGDDINFEIRNKYEGIKGQKLLALQSRYTNDRRFTLDSRFVDEENDEENVGETYDDEKQKQYEILESVIGRKLTEMPGQNQNKHNAPRGMLRYDPSNVEHSKFEMKGKRDTIEEQPKKEIVQEAPVEVSKEKFYKVTDNLKQSFKEKQEFSLLSMFGRTEEKDEKEPDNQDAMEINQTNFNTIQNPFRYDSSDNEAEEAPNNTEQIDQFDQRQFGQNFSRFGEKFFFQIDDERLKDGVNFLQKFNSEENTQKFVDTRRKIKQIIRGKIRNVQRDNRLFRKKIGQHKQIKIKKAKRN